MFLPLLIAFTLGLVCEPLLERLLKILQSTYRDYRFRRQMFAQDAFVKSLKTNSEVLYDGETGYIDPRFLSSSPDDGWFDAGKGTQ